ncbi:YHYH domain-containing protein [Massilia violaceinigra]|uniref:YHYH domain-containing protein n=2 Tax=Massilia violaceinigra TaxID=2045208 RepID=A0ABY4AFL4_9BURK|nr:YHYH domain-containing protein [Massilia violaceinigra]
MWMVSALFLLCAADASAHGGGLNAEGCHHNRRTGDYHCHRAQPSERRAMARLAIEERAEEAPAQAAQENGDRPRRLQERQATGPTCHTGPRGGTYTITASGRKNYGGC